MHRALPPGQPHSKVRSIKPLGTRFGVQVGTHTGQKVPSGACHVQPMRWFQHSFSPLDLDPILGLGFTVWETT